MERRHQELCLLRCEIWVAPQAQFSDKKNVFFGGSRTIDESANTATAALNAAEGIPSNLISRVPFNINLMALGIRGGGLRLPVMCREKEQAGTA